jgi:hypothetical protein
MIKNVGGVDRILRIAVGAAILAIGLSGGAWWGWLGLIPLGTAFFQWCPTYLPFGISTCKKAA